MDIDWSNILVGALGGAGVGGIITHYVKKKIEKPLNEQLADYNSELRKLNDNYQIVFSKLHADRTETIKNLYNILYEVYQNVRSLEWAEGKDDIEYLKVVARKLSDNSFELQNNYQRNRIYFSEDICKLFDLLNEKLGLVIVPINTYYTHRGNLSEEDQEKEPERKEKMREYMKEDIPKLKEEIEKEFKKILGVIEE
ncbi:hypothetical protein [Bacillus cereus]|uniref:hypothetical protein n=1 Tax=Bacillus cereus TaxID=1396 RepID=UPI0021110287|nr:hypothetical protein [Bacillus cereus]